MKLLPVLTALLFLNGCSERVPLEAPRTPVNYPQILALTANRTVIGTGQPVVLRWNSSNAASVTIDQAIDPLAHVRADFQSLGTYPASGTLEVHPAQSTTYVVSCGNDKIGCSSASIHITVK